MSIFISYRRSDVDIVGRMHDAFERSFGAHSVFQDVEDLGAGRSFRHQLERAIEASKVVVAVIGPDWVQERIHDSEDVLRQELEMALQKGIPIVPVTLNATTLPDPRSLPPTLRRVLEYQVYVVRSGAEFRSTMGLLVDALHPLLGMRSSALRSAAPAEELTSAEWYKKARSHASLGERAEALECLTRAVELEPGFGEAHAFRGAILTMEGRRAEAIVAFRSALAVNRDDSEVQLLLASALAATGESREAKWLFEKALKSPRAPVEEGVVRARYAEALMDIGQADEAIEQFDRAIRLIGDDAPPETVGYALRRKGDALFEASRFADALREYDAAVACAGPSPELSNAQGLAQLRTGRADKARDAFLAGIEMAPDSAGLAYNLGCAYSQMGEVDAALESLSRAFDLDPALKQSAGTDPDLERLREVATARLTEIMG